MTDQAQSSQGTDLVGLYAERLKSRGRQPEERDRYRRTTGGVQTFGRRPAIRQLTSSRRRRAATALMATAVLAGSGSAVASAASDRYEVQDGDTLSAVSGQTGVSVEDLVSINNIENPDVIHPGDLLMLNGEVDVAVGDTVYRIKQGDTLSSIADDHGVGVDALIAMNEIENPDLILPGDSVIIPTRGQYDSDQSADLAQSEEQSQPAADEQSEPAADEQSQGVDDAPATLRPSQYQVANLHLIAPGEILADIAQRYRVPIEHLAAANEIENPDLVQSGTLLSIPVVPSADEINSLTEQGSGGTVLEGVPAMQQSLTLSCESAAASIATSYWGNQISEWVFIENMPYDANPHHGFRGNMSGQFGGTDDYGVYAKPLAQMLANYGFMGDEFYTDGDPEPLKNRIDQGQPVLVWMTSGASDQERFYEEHEGERFTLVPQQHVVVAYGYDENGVHVSDPGNGQHRTFGWDEFIQSWSKFDGMSLAVYPNS